MQLNYYGFSDKPFELSPDPKFLYLTSGYKEALETVWKGITERKGLIILTGEVGTGKTMLIYSIIARLPTHIKAALIFHPTYNFKELIELIYLELGESPPTEGINDFEIRILAYLRKLREQGKILAVFIDEAQKLSEDVLRGLLNFLDSEPWISQTLQLVLVGQTEFEETLNTTTLGYRSRISPKQVRINILSMKESLDYIEHRLIIVGKSSSEIFSPQALSLITENSKGIPRVINNVCDNALFIGSNEWLQRIDLDTIQKVIRSLDGPEIKSKVWRKSSKQAPPSQSRYRLSVKQGLLIFFGLALGIVFFLWHTEFTDYLTDSRWPWFVKTQMGKIRNPGEVIKPQKETQKNSAGLPVIPKDVPKPTQEKSLEKQAPSIETPSIRMIQVKKGTTLSLLALQYYGKFNESLIDLILFHNPTIKNIDLVLVDQKIKLPELNEEALIIEVASKNYNIYLGTFSDSKKANEFNNQPSLKGKKITIQSKNISRRRTWYRVEAGIFESKQEALEVIKTLRGKGLLPFF
jgi:general secretion pathway protein A